jgi:hypothetical protein
MPPKIPVTVTAEFKARVENFVEAITACISQPASSGLNNSMVCRIAIEEMLDRYEKTPEKMARKLGFSPVRQK